jgi:hypothetical protein
MIKNEALHKFLLPWALTSGKVVTRNIVKTIKKWAAGEIYASDGKDQATYKVASDALATDAEWFEIEHPADSDKKVTRLTPIHTIAEARKLGYKKYVVPEFPEGFDPDAKVGNQEFTYGQMYAAWRGEFEQLITDPKNTYPLFNDLRGAPDYNAWESVECASDDVVTMFEQLANMTQEIDGMYVDFYDNDPWWEQGDSGDFGVHIYDGIIKPEQIIKKYLPKKKKVVLPDKTLTLTATEANWLKKLFNDHHIDTIAEMGGPDDYETMMNVAEKLRNL